MSGHTKGPWRVAYGREIYCEDQERYPHCLAEVYDTAEALEGDDPEADANARLIAAAPELLDALREALIWVECMERSKGTLNTEYGINCDGITEDLAKMKAAIAKATQS